MVQIQVIQCRQGVKFKYWKYDLTGKEQAKGKADNIRVKEIKRTDTYPDLRYLATGLWIYIITTGLTTGLPKWITGGGGL
jgi:hypothetical protein